MAEGSITCYYPHVPVIYGISENLNRTMADTINSLFDTSVNIYINYKNYGQSFNYSQKTDLENMINAETRVLALTSDTKKIRNMRLNSMLDAYNSIFPSGITGNYKSQENFTSDIERFEEKTFWDNVQMDVYTGSSGPQRDNFVKAQIDAVRQMFDQTWDMTMQFKNNLEVASYLKIFERLFFSLVSQLVAVSKLRDDFSQENSKLDAQNAINGMNRKFTEIFPNGPDNGFSMPI
jgi:hypothetical protein